MKTLTECIITDIKHLSENKSNILILEDYQKDNEIWNFKKYELELLGFLKESIKKINHNLLQLDDLEEFNKISNNLNQEILKIQENYKLKNQDFNLFKILYNQYYRSFIQKMIQSLFGLSYKITKYKHINLMNEFREGKKEIYHILYIWLHVTDINIAWQNQYEFEKKSKTTKYYGMLANLQQKTKWVIKNRIFNKEKLNELHNLTNEIIFKKLIFKFKIPTHQNIILNLIDRNCQQIDNSDLAYNIVNNSIDNMKTLSNFYKNITNKILYKSSQYSGNNFNFNDLSKLHSSIYDIIEYAITTLNSESLEKDDWNSLIEWIKDFGKIMNIIKNKEVPAKLIILYTEEHRKNIQFLIKHVFNLDTEINRNKKPYFGSIQTNKFDPYLIIYLYIHLLNINNNFYKTFDLELNDKDNKNYLSIVCEIQKRYYSIQNDISKNNIIKKTINNEDIYNIEMSIHNLMNNLIINKIIPRIKAERNKTNENTKTNEIELKKTIEQIKC